MTERLKLLHLEDRIEDAKLIERQLRRAGLNFDYVQAEGKQGFEAGLAANPDVILADYYTPGFSGMDALALQKKFCPEAAFILVSGAIGEELAADAIREGADDYILKDRLTRLALAVSSTMEKRHAFMAKRKAEEELTANAEFMKQVLDNLAEGVLTATEGGVISTFYPSAERLFDKKAKDAQGVSLRQLFAHPAREEFMRFFETEAQRGKPGAKKETVGLRTNGSTFPLEVKLSEMNVRGDRSFVLVLHEPASPSLRTKLQMRQKPPS